MNVLCIPSASELSTVPRQLVFLRDGEENVPLVEGKKMRDRAANLLEDFMRNTAGCAGGSPCKVGMSDSWACIRWFGQTLQLGFANKSRLHLDRQGALNPNLQILRTSVCMLSLGRTLFKAGLFMVVLCVLKRKACFCRNNVMIYETQSCLINSCP